MTDFSGKAFDPDTMLHQWIRMWAQPWSGFPEAEVSAISGDASQRDPSLEASLRFLKLSSMVWTNPAKWAEMSSGLNSMPFVFMNMLTPMVDNIAEMHGKWLENAASAGKMPDDFDIGHLEEQSLDMFNRFYDAGFRKLLNIPQLGLTREFQEKINFYIDRFNILQFSLAELLLHLYAPLKTSYASFMVHLADLAEAGDLPADAKAYYQRWLKMLEGDYMKELQKPEFVSVLSKTLTVAAYYAKAKKDLQNDLMHQLSLPAPRDLENLYKDLHDMKKRLKRIERKCGNNL